ncbi:FecR family protein [Candidatus Nitrospira salsa]
MSAPERRDPISPEFHEVWKELDGVKPLLTQELEEAEAFWFAHSRTPRSESISRWSVLPLNLGAWSALAAVIVLVMWWWVGVGANVTHYQTAKGKQQTVTLADGSIVMLNTDTMLSVLLSNQERVVELEQGEARFTVTHDEHRPFHVKAGNGMIHDLGTQFIVKHLSDQVEIFVFEGTVEVGVLQPVSSATASGRRLLTQGQQVRYTVEGHMSSIEPFEEHIASAWTEGKLVFHAQPLNTVLNELARYAPGEIRLLDPTLADLPISGIFNLENLGRFPQALQEAFPITATQINPQLVVLDRKSSS